MWSRPTSPLPEVRCPCGGRGTPPKTRKTKTVFSIPFHFSKLFFIIFLTQFHKKGVFHFPDPLPFLRSCFHFFRSNFIKKISVFHFPDPLPFLRSCFHFFRSKSIFQKNCFSLLRSIFTFQKTLIDNDLCLEI